MKKRYIAAGLAAAALCTGVFAAAQAGYIAIGRTLSPGEVDAMVQQSVQTAVQELEQKHQSELRFKDTQILELTSRLEEMSDSEPEEIPEVLSDDNSGKAEESSAEQNTPTEISIEPPIIAPTLQTAPENVPLEKNDVSAVHSIPNAGTAFEGHSVTVNDWTTPATFSGGKDWPITVWYFFADDGRELGSISGESAMKITQKHPVSSIGWEFWFADAFNEFRKVSSNGVEFLDSSDKQAEAERSKNYRISDFSAEEYAHEAFDLINDARKDNGLHPVEMDDYAMELAEMRVEELEESYSHNRPDGGRMSLEYGCGEIINRRANTAEVAVSSWLDSQGHYDIIMADRYNSAGIACFEGSDGVVYWCMLFFR